MIRRRILFLNVVLFLLVSLVAYQLVASWESFEDQNDLQQVLRRAQDRVEVENVPSLELAANTQLEHDFFVVAERDLFSPERRLEESEPDEVEVVEAPEFPQRPEMLGAATINGRQQAYLTVYSSRSGRNQGESRTVEMGDDVQGYTVADITETTVTLRWNDTVEVIDMMDSEPSQQAAPAAQTMAAVNIIKIGSRHAAVETTTVSEPGEGEEGQGLQVGVVGGQQDRGRAMGSQGIRGGQGRMPGQSGMSGRTGGRSQRGGLPATIGVGGRRTTPTQNIPR